MKNSEFNTEVPAKWVLCGEHSVLRGKRALAFPYSKFSLTLSYKPQGNGLSFTHPEHQAQILNLLERAQIWLKDHSYLMNPDVKSAQGTLNIQTTIPVGAGLGSSAALSVAIARFAFWQYAREYQTKENVVLLATHLEDVFHGKSSGLDVSVVAENKPILFSVRQGAEPIKMGPLPRFELHDSGLRGSTRECILRVQSEKRVMEIDEQMGLATEQAADALLYFHLDPVRSQRELALAMNQAQGCFEAWGLVPDAMLKQKEGLIKKGALAVKLTGAGLGGFWVALMPS